MPLVETMPPSMLLNVAKKVDMKARMSFVVLPGFLTICFGRVFEFDQILFSKLRKLAKSIARSRCLVSSAVRDPCGNRYLPQQLWLGDNKLGFGDSQVVLQLGWCIRWVTARETSSSTNDTK